MEFRMGTPPRLRDAGCSELEPRLQSAKQRLFLRDPLHCFLFSTFWEGGLPFEIIQERTAARFFKATGRGGGGELPQSQ